MSTRCPLKNNESVVQWIKLNILPIVSIISLCSMAFADDKSEQQAKDDREKEELERSAEEKASEQRAYIGVLMGGNRSAASDGTTSESGISPMIGVTAGFKLSPLFGLSFLGSRYALTNSTEVFGLPVGTDSNTTLLLAQGNFFLSAFHVGVELGTSTNSWRSLASSLSIENSNLSIVYGPQGGMDFKVGKTISLGGELHYLFSTARNVTNNIQVLANLKIWL
ncbi:MAG: hypothetical protein ABIQ95_17525 [Bdellovibrionia bacterium]